MARILAVLALLSTAACPRPPPAAESADPVRYATPRARGVVDAHMHISPTEVERLHGMMDEVGVSWGLNLSGMWPGGRLERQIAAAEESGRMLVACNLPWRLAGRYENFPMISASVIEDSARLGARALKISKSLGLGALKYDRSLLKVDDPWLDPIWKAAGDYGMPVVIHVGDPKAFWLPTDENNERFEELSAHPGWSNFGIEGLPSFQELLDALSRVVARHPRTTFVSVHFGNNAEDPFWVGEQLDRYPNLYVDLAARLPEVGRHDPDKLHDLFVRHADRILFATDLGVSPGGELMLGSTGTEPTKRDEVGPFFAKHWQWLETRTEAIPSPTPIQGRWTINGIGLPDPVLDKVYRENAIRVFGLPPLLEPR